MFSICLFQKPWLSIVLDTGVVRRFQSSVRGWKVKGSASSPEQLPESQMKQFL